MLSLVDQASREAEAGQVGERQPQNERTQAGRCWGSIGSTLASHAQGPGFNPQYVTIAVGPVIRLCKALATKPDDPSSNPRPYVMEGEN